jgi:hypothetical protein
MMCQTRFQGARCVNKALVIVTGPQITPHWTCLVCANEWSEHIGWQVTCISPVALVCDRCPRPAAWFDYDGILIRGHPMVFCRVHAAERIAAGRGQPFSCMYEVPEGDHD